MANHETVNSAEEKFRKELYFLIAKYLSNGPCHRAAQALREELFEHRLLPNRLDWMGREHAQNFQETSNRNQHIGDNFLERICKRLVPLLEHQVPASVRGVHSLLGAGRQSLLRQKSDRSRTSISSLTVCRHDAPLLPPGRGIQSANIAQVLCSREACGTSSKRNIAQPNLYAKQVMHRRILGHLSAVYCVLFDRTGQCIITGADDSLVKIWSSEDGRLLATLRGHQLEISDIAINYENTLVAAGSCDKVIRVWSLKTMSPVAVLQGHTGMITSLQFCPSPLNEARYLMSTGGDGTVCFWKWDVSNSTFDTKPIRFIEKTRPGTQMVCSSFSPGGTFLVTGSTDHIIRIYQMTPGPPERIAELDAHNDHVDSIQFSHGGDRFLSGSRDATSRIWFFRRSQWKSILLDVSTRPPGSPPLDEALKALKLRVTMVGWDLWDQHVITAVNNHTLKVWEATTGNLVHVLEGHGDEVFVLEAHPTDPHFFLSAGHDGCVILWDLRNGNIITKFHNTLEGQGHGAVFDCKFSPDGLTFACCDSHGHLCIFGYGSSEPYMKVPAEQFFHTDYRPLIRDSNNHVLDEQTQMLPHLMPPPFLVDVDGNPHPLHYQQLVPGHSSNVRTPSRNRTSDQQFMPPLLAEIEAAEARERMGLQSPPPQGTEPPQFPPPPQPPIQSPGGIRNYGMRQSGDVEGVRLAHGNVPVIQDVSEADITAWRKRRIVPDVKPSIAKFDEEKRHMLGREELFLYLREKKRRPLPSTSIRRQEPVPPVPKPARTARRAASRPAGQSSRSYRGTSSSSRYSTRAAAALDIDESAEEEAMVTPSESEEDEEWSESSSSESSEYSDWTEEVGLRVQRQTDDRRSRRVRRLVSTSDEGEGAGPSSPQRQPKPKKESKPKKKPVKKKKVPKKPGPDQIQETLEFYQPPDWLMCTRPRLSPYVPQIGDEVYYLRQGHELYVKEVAATKVYDINPKKQCFYKLRLKSEELCRIVSLHYSVGPPTLCCLKLTLISPETGNSTGASFTVKYHDMPDVLDFIILRQYYDESVERNWQPGDRFRAVIDDSWWAGMITDRSPYQPELQDSYFQCFTVHWDTGEVERMSPWDLQPVTENDVSHQEADASGAGTSDIPLTNEDRQAMTYVPDDSEWFNEGRDPMTPRLLAGIEAICLLRFAGLFVWPVDVQSYPDYWTIVAFPTDLNTIKERLENRFYRRANALLWEIRQLERNALQFNEEDSQVVKDAQKLCTIMANFIKDSTCTDILSLVPEDEAENGEIEVAEVSHESDQEGDSQESQANGKRKRGSAQGGARNKRVRHEEPEEPPEEPWLRASRELLEFLFQLEDAEPFRYPVNLEEFPDYAEVVSEPMDFSTIFDRLESGFYVGPEEFVRHVRLIFSNSRAYNTMTRSRIYGMTIRLSAMFEDRVDTVLGDWYDVASGGARRTRLRTQQLLQSHPGPSGLAVQRSQPRTTGASTHTPSTSGASRSQGVPPIIISRQPRTQSVSIRTSESEAGESNNRAGAGASASTLGSRPETRTSRRVTVPTYTVVTSRNRPGHASDTVGDASGTRTTRSSARQELSRRFSARSSTSEASDLNDTVSSAYGTRYATRRQASLARNAMQEEEEEDETEEEYAENGEASSEEGEEGEEENGLEEESGEEDEEDEEEEDDDDEEEEEESSDEENSSPESRRTSRRPAKPTHRPTVQHKQAPNASSRQRRQSDRSRSRRTSDASADSARAGGNSSRPARSLRSSRPGTREVRYAESESDSDQERTLGVSSRGRVRRPTMRMIDYVE